MKISSLRSPLIGLVTCSISLHAQWDAIKLAKGWARADISGMCSFYDPVSDKLIINWVKDAGESCQIDMKVTGIRPEKWFIDKYECAWVISGTQLQRLDKSGKSTASQTLPAEVGDLAWGPKSFYLSYRTAEPYIEKRDEKSGNVVWTYGSKPKKGEPSQNVLHRITVGEQNNLYIVTGDSFSVSILDSEKGKKLGDSLFALNDALPPKLQLGTIGRGPITWLSPNIIVAAVPASQLSSPVFLMPATPPVPDPQGSAPKKMTGLLLAKMVTTESSLVFLPTGLSEDHTFVGISIESEAIFITPKGGLVFVPIR